MKIIVSAKKMVPPLTGVGTYTYQLIRHLTREDPHLEIALFGLFFKNFFSRRAFLRSVGKGRMKVRTLPIPDRLLDWCWRRGLGTVDGMLRGYELYHATDFLVPALDRIPLVSTLHDVSVFACPQFHTPFNARYFQDQIARTMQKSSRVLAVSHWTAGEVARVFPKFADKIRCVPSGVDAAFFQRIDRVELQKVQQRYGLSSEYVLFVGTLEPRKNIMGLLEAYLLLKKELRKRFLLVLIGRRGWMYEEIFTFIKEKGLEDRVHMLGYVAQEDMPALYQGAFAFVYTSFYEGFGFPVLEAMASGVPTICSRDSSLGEIAGDYAWKIDPKQPAEIAEALQEIHENPGRARNLADQGVERARTFDWRRTANQTMAVYKEVLG